MSTIFARSSAPGKAGVSVFRISGHLSLNVMKSLTQESNYRPRHMYFKTLLHPESQEKIDEALICYFAAPDSFTGEDIVEIHCHGSIAIEKLLTSAVLSIEGVRYAEAGEFARRAFLNNKFDLTRAEAMVDIIDAETVMQHKQAMRQMSGELESLYVRWRKQLLKIMSLVEAYIDFPEEDIPETVISGSQQTITGLVDSINVHLNDNRRGERLRHGLTMALLGQPNVGKSSVMNLLSQREISIVSSIAGTTRDTLESHLDIGGYPIIMLDTAGIAESTDDIIEQEGIKRAKKAATNADIKLVVLDSSSLDANSLQAIIPLIDKNSLVICNKVDLLSDEIESTKQYLANELQCHDIIMLSAKYNNGIETLLAAIENIAADKVGEQSSPALTRERHRIALNKAVEILSALDFNHDLELVAEDIRISAHHLQSLVGRIDVDEVLGEIFSSFCIGK